MARLDRSLDRSVRDRLGLARGERPLAWARADDRRAGATAGARPAATARSHGAGATQDGPAAADEVPDDTHVWVGTRAALYVPGELDHGEPYRRVPWASIDRADWNDADQELRITELAGFGQPMPRSVGRLRGADRLLQLVRERVTASVVAVRTVPLQGRLGVRVIARRDPDRSGELTWSAVLDSGLDATDPAVIDAAQEALERVRAEVGLDG